MTARERERYVRSAVILILLCMVDFAIALFVGLSMGLYPENWNIPWAGTAAPFLIVVSFVPMVVALILSRNIAMVKEGKKPGGLLGWPKRP